MAMGDPGTLSNPYQYANVLIADGSITALAAAEDGPLEYDPETEVQYICTRNRPPTVSDSTPWPETGMLWMDGFPFDAS